MGILDGIVTWIAEQVMNLLDMVTSSVLGALGCDTISAAKPLKANIIEAEIVSRAATEPKRIFLSVACANTSYCFKVLTLKQYDMSVFLRYFPAAETMYNIFVALALGLILLNWVWQLFKNFGLSAGVEAEDPIKLTIRTVMFILLTLYAKDITDIALKIGGTPYNWILTSELPPISFADFNSVMLVLLGVLASGSVALIALVLVLMLAWNYIKLLFEAAERYILLGVLIFTAPVAFAMGASMTTANIFKSWCRRLAGQIFLLVMNAWCLRLFTSMVGTFIANPLSL